MSDAANLRDSTQIQLPAASIDDLRDTLESEFVVTVVEQGGQVRIIGSPVEIKGVSDFLARHGVTVR